MMRVAYVSVDPGIPVFGTKGASVHVQEVIRELLARGHQVRVLTTRKGDQIPADLAELEVIEFPLTSRDPADREQEQQHASAEIAQRILADGADLVYERYSLFSRPPSGSLNPTCHWWWGRAGPARARSCRPWPG